MKEPGQAFALAVYTPFEGLELLGTSNFFFSKFFKNLFLIGRQLLSTLCNVKQPQGHVDPLHPEPPSPPAPLSRLSTG